MPCGLPRRLMIIIYDTVIVIALLMAATALMLPFQSGPHMAGKDPWYTAYLLAVWYGYLAWCWRRGGVTLGMRSWRVRLVSDQPGPPGHGQCAIRFVCSLASAGLAGLGFLTSLLDAHKRCWHDRASRTRLLFTPKNAASD